MLFRFLITGHLGIAPYIGAHLGAHSLFFLDKNNTHEYSYTDLKFTNNIAHRKSKQEYPCNLELSELKKLKQDHYTKCYTENTMSLLLEMIKHREKKEPFPSNDSRNFNAWKYVKTLDKFFMSISNYNEIDSSLKNFSVEILKYNLNDFFYIFLENIKRGYNFQIVSNKNLIFIYTLIIIIICIYGKLSEQKNKQIIKFSYKNNDILLFFILTNLISIILLSVIHIPKLRLMSVQGIFFIPVIFSYLISNIINYYLEKKKT